MLNNFDYIIYHKKCIDGFSGFFVASLNIKNISSAYIYEDVPSTTRVPPNIKNKNILIIDVAYKKEVLEEVFKVAKSVVFIDHHDTIKDDVQYLYKKYNKSKNITIVYDEKKSGATLTWLYFYKKTRDIPLFLQYIEDQDAGKWLLPETKSFIIALRIYHNLDINNIKKWNKLFDESYVKKLCRRGKYMKKYNDHLINKNIKNHSIQYFPSKLIYKMNPTIFKKVGQYKVAVWCGHNSPSVTELSIVALEKLDCDFCIFWVYNIDNKKYILSMRSKKTNVGKICKIFGGGGHKLAAACSISYNTFIKLDDLFV